jgi:hypothetical protein
VQLRGVIAIGLICFLAGSDCGLLSNWLPAALVCRRAARLFCCQGQTLSECGQLLAAEHRLKGDRNAHEEI